MTAENVRMREASGGVESDDPLVSFLYALARDHMPIGQIEELYDQGVRRGLTCQFTNGWLALWAKDLAERLRPVA